MRREHLGHLRQRRLHRRVDRRRAVGEQQLLRQLDGLASCSGDSGLSRLTPSVSSSWQFLGPVGCVAAAAFCGTNCGMVSCTGPGVHVSSDRSVSEQRQEGVLVQMIAELILLVGGDTELAAHLRRRERWRAGVGLGFVRRLQRHVRSRKRLGDPHRAHRPELAHAFPVLGPAMRRRAPARDERRGRDQQRGDRRCGLTGATPLEGRRFMAAQNVGHRSTISLQITEPAQPIGQRGKSALLLGIERNPRAGAGTAAPRLRPGFPPRRARAAAPRRPAPSARARRRSGRTPRSTPRRAASRAPRARTAAARCHPASGRRCNRQHPADHRSPDSLRSDPPRNPHLGAGLRNGAHSARPTTRLPPRSTPARA